MKFQPCGDCLDQIVRRNLTECRGYLKKDLAKAQAGEDYFHVFDTDTEADIKLLKKNIKAFDRVLAYYGGPCDE
jgi:hypothetical protein